MPTLNGGRGTRPRKSFYFANDCSPLVGKLVVPPEEEPLLETSLFTLSFQIVENLYIIIYVLF